ncbi:endonuclease MutS2 [Iocasia frigidifontis]|uniref:Endonuclease MutS2 n=1 Tax=Iocasia fonsfrigidae TaxID=2682810 RepID=A0A8A7KIA0_9FIRM|nr:endonuclease MutS2 [Iocasia fonsfrigidae]QTL98577.1 endonuclease MutS2 [Iocasia fonsfrigidae]
MDKGVIAILELNKIKEEVRKHTATIIGGEIVEKLTPVSDIRYVKKRLQEVTAAKEILNEYGHPPFGGIRDLREILKKVDKGIVLSAKELMNVRNTLAAYSRLEAYFNDLINNLDPRLIEQRFAPVTKQGEKLTPLPELKKELDYALDEYGEIKDRASKKLASLRSEIRIIGNRIRDKLDNIIKDQKYQSMLQDNLVTRRGDRYVVPVRQEYRNSFAGIVHDQSASGMTLFMEPMAVLKLNNKLKGLQRQEEEEVYRILQQLSGLVQQDMLIIKENLKIVSLLDLIFARAAYSNQLKGIAPEINEEGMIDIKQGRHPLLKDEVVPIDIAVGSNKFNTLVITGPNTGGKTVALKTVGLFVLMMQIGLHIPADRGTTLSIFKNVFADIGDEQSIEQNLSTFSSHITRIRSFLEKADQDSLVLMDELGAGTDPREGAALGIAILEKLKSIGAVTIVTTHYSQLKTYAYEQTGVENASVEFDLETLKPTYRILMGIPGGSNALTIAHRLGIPSAIIEKARTMLSGEEIEVESIIAGLNSERKRYRELKESSARKEKEAAELKEKYQALLKDLQQNKQDIIKKAREDAAGIIDTARRESKQILQELKQNDLNSRSEIDRMGNKLNEKFKEVDKKFEDSKGIDSNSRVTDEIEIGDQVRLKNVGRKGEVTDINKDKGEATIQAGIITLKAGLDELIKAEMPDDKKQEMVKRYRVSKAQQVSPKLDLRGERYDTAQGRLDKYLDDVFLAGIKQVEVIHGKGTGALRDAVAEVLKENPHITFFRLGKPEEGGSGVTIVEIN